MVILEYTAIVSYEIDTDTNKVKVTSKFINEKGEQKAKTKKKPKTKPKATQSMLQPERVM